MGETSLGGLRWFPYRRDNRVPALQRLGIGGEDDVVPFPFLCPDLQRGAAPEVQSDAGR